MAIGVALILGALALLHAYWGIVGVSGRSIALPEVARVRIVPAWRWLLERP